MTAPGKPATAPTATAPVAAPGDAGARDQEAREYAERLSRLEHRAEGRHQAAALEKLQRKAATPLPAANPAATGLTPGSDYGAYIQSRLKDALAATLVYQTKRPETAVHLYIDRRGTLTRYVIKKSSRDKLFDDSVIRTIERAKALFPPTPDNRDFDKLFLFSPEEVTNK
jgi:TonB family protein